MNAHNVFYVVMLIFCVTIKASEEVTVHCTDGSVVFGKKAVVESSLLSSQEAQDKRNRVTYSGIKRPLKIFTDSLEQEIFHTPAMQKFLNENMIENLIKLLMITHKFGVKGAFFTELLKAIKTVIDSHHWRGHFWSTLGDSGDCLRLFSVLDQLHIDTVVPLVTAKGAKIIREKYSRHGGFSITACQEYLVDSFNQLVRNADLQVVSKTIDGMPLSFDRYIVHPQGKMVACFVKPKRFIKGLLKIYSLPSFEEEEDEILFGVEGTCLWHPTQQICIACSEYGMLYRIDFEQRKMHQKTFPHFEALALSPSGSRFALLDSNNILTIFETESGQVLSSGALVSDDPSFAWRVPAATKMHFDGREDALVLVTQQGTRGSYEATFARVAATEHFLRPSKVCDWSDLCENSGGIKDILVAREGIWFVQSPQDRAYLLQVEDQHTIDFCDTNKEPLQNVQFFKDKNYFFLETAKSRVMIGVPPFLPHAASYMIRTLRDGKNPLPSVLPKHLEPVVQRLPLKDRECLLGLFRQKNEEQSFEKELCLLS